MTGQALLEVDRVSKSFARGGAWSARSRSVVRAVSNVSFALRSGEVLGLVGESGSGKSTLGRMAIRLLEPSAGQVSYDGRAITHLSGRALRPLRRQMQPIFQDPYTSLNPKIRIGETIAEGIRLHGLAPKSEIRDRVAISLKRVGLDPAFGRRYPKALSGGQRQRVAIARALSVEPRLVVADEPVSALDVSIQAEIVDLLTALQEKARLAMLFISHDLRVVRQLADRIAVLYLGHLVEMGPADQVFSDPAHPYTEALLDAMPSHPGAPKRRKIVLRGELPNPIAPPSGCVFHPRCPYAIAECKTAPMTLRSIGNGRATACIRDDIELKPAAAGAGHG